MHCPTWRLSLGGSIRGPASPEEALLAKSWTLAGRVGPEVLVMDMRDQAPASRFKRRPINRESLKINPVTMDARVRSPSLTTSSL